MKEFKEKTTEELLKTLGDKRKALQDFRFAQSHSKTKNVKEGRTLKREIAQILTVINQR